MSHAVYLTVTPREVALMPGDTVLFALVVRNAGRRTARVHLDVGGVPADWYALERSQIALGAGTSVHVHLALRPPTCPRPLSGRHILAIRVTGEEDSGVQATTDVVLTIGGEGELSLDLEPADAEGRMATFRLTYRNRSPAPVAFTLLARDSEEGLRFHPEPADPVIVLAGGTRSIVVHVVPKVRATVGVSQAYDIVFQALQPGTMAESNPNLMRRACFTYVPFVSMPAILPAWMRRLPLWAYPLPLVLLLVPLLLLLAHERTLAHEIRRPLSRPTAAPTHGVLNGQPQMRRTSVKGSVTPPPALTVLLNPTSVQFGEQEVGTTSRAQIVHVANLGPIPLAVTTITITGADPGDYAESNTCAHTSVGVYGGCAISVRFAPLTAGNRLARLVVLDSAASRPRSVPLSGRGWTGSTAGAAGNQT